MKYWHNTETVLLEIVLFSILLLCYFYNPNILSLLVAFILLYIWNIYYYAKVFYKLHYTANNTNNA